MLDEKNMAIKLFNETWDLLDKDTRTEQEDALMIHKAHTSLYHWLQVGGPLEEQRGEWMVSHVYAVLEMAESAIFHAKRCFECTTTHKIKDFDLSFAYEALARAYALTDKTQAKKYYLLAKDSLKQIKDVEDKAYTSSQIENINI